MSVTCELIPLFGIFSRRGLNPVELDEDSDRPDGQLDLTICAFHQLGQYTSSPGRRGYCYAKLAVFFTSGDRNHRQYSLPLPTEDVQAELWWVTLRYSSPARSLSPNPLLTGLDVGQLR